MHFTLGVVLLDPGQIKGMQILSNLTHLKQKNPFVLGHTAIARRILLWLLASPSLCVAAAGGVAPHRIAAAAAVAAPYLSLAPI